MEISAISSSNYGYSGMEMSLASQATAQQNTKVQDEIAVSVITQIQDQQEMQAEALIDMIQTNLIDIYA